MNIPLEQLEPHPLSPNVMSRRRFTKLVRVIRETGRYPAIIVRPAELARYQIIDGHQRVEALRTLGAREARCDMWEVDDGEALRLLLALNRLTGSDDPYRRATIVSQLLKAMTPRELARRTPDDAGRLARIVRLLEPPPPPALLASPHQEALSRPPGLFLSPNEAERLRAIVLSIDGDQRRSLAQLLKLEEATP